MAAVQNVMAGERILWATCTGEGPGGGLAVLCGVATALYFPATSVDVITFGMPWAGFNSEFAWAFDRLISVYYLWPFNTSTVPPVKTASGADLGAVNQIAASLELLIEQNGTMQAAVTLPNLPPALPPSQTKLQEPDVHQPTGSYDNRTADCYQSFAGQTYGFTPTCVAGTANITDLGILAPPPILPPPGLLPPSSSCPTIICKTRQFLDMSCRGFGNHSSNMASAAALQNLPFVSLHDPRTNADAIVAWNETSKGAIFLWKYTNETRDWVTDANALKTDDFVNQINKDFPAAKGVTKTFGDPQVHRGFYNQFASLAINGVNATNLTQALYKLSAGQEPLFITISGEFLTCLHLSPLIEEKH